MHICLDCLEKIGKKKIKNASKNSKLQNMACMNNLKILFINCRKQQYRYG